MTPDPSKARARLPRGAWVLLPLAAALAYAAVHPLFRASPSLREMVPEDVVQTHRFRDLQAFDAAMTPAGERVAPASLALGADMNLPGLPGVDRSRPLLLVTIAPPSRHASAFYVLPVADAGAMLETFRDPALAERHARYLEIHGDLAAVGWDRAAVRRAVGTGDLWPEERGEDWARAADWPRLVAFAEEHATEPPFRELLEAIGVDVDGVYGRRPTSPGEMVSHGRLPIVRDAWKRVSLHAWSDRVRADLVPAAGGALAKAVKEAASRAAGDPRVEPPPYVNGPVLVVHGESSRRVCALVLRDVGVWFPPGVTAESFESGSLTLWAEETRDSWTVVLAGATLPDLAVFGLGKEGSPPAALTAPYGGTALPTALAFDEARTARVKVAAFGPDAAAAARNAAASLSPSKAAPPAGGGPTLLAWFRLPAEPARRLLGKVIEPGGLLAPLGGGALEGTLSTDGDRLILEVRRK